MSSTVVKSTVLGTLQARVPILVPWVAGKLRSRGRLTPRCLEVAANTRWETHSARTWDAGAELEGWKGSDLTGDLGNGMRVGKSVSGRVSISLKRQIIC